MQVLKDEIREAIFEAALQKFAEKGFKKTTMADIAAEAEISVGNLYLYYKNKRDIFVSVIPPTFVEDLKSLIARKIRSAAGASLDQSRQNSVFLLVEDEMIDYYCEHRLRFIVAIENAEETPYAGGRDELVNILESLFFDYLRSIGRGEEAEDPRLKSLIVIIYNNLINGILGVLKTCDEREALKGGLRRLMAYHLFGLNGFMK